VDFDLGGTTEIVATHDKNEIVRLGIEAERQRVGEMLKSELSFDVGGDHRHRGDPCQARLY